MDKQKPHNFFSVMWLSFILFIPSLIHGKAMATNGRSKYYALRGLLINKKAPDF